MLEDRIENRSCELVAWVLWLEYRHGIIDDVNPISNVWGARVAYDYINLTDEELSWCVEYLE